MSIKIGLHKYHIFLPHVIEGRSNEDQSLDQVRIFQNHSETDPPSHAASNQNQITLSIFALGNLDRGLTVIEPVMELQGMEISSRFAQS